MLNARFFALYFALCILHFAFLLGCNTATNIAPSISSATPPAVAGGTSLNPSDGERTVAPTPSNTPAAGQTGTELSIGAVADTTFWQGINPVLSTGMKWTWVTTGSQIQQTESALEVIQVTGNTARLRNSINGQLVSDITASTRVGSPLISASQTSTQATYKLMGHEDITVPAGTFKGTSKLMADLQGGATSTLWAAQGVGTVKSQTAISEALINNMELKSFRANTL